MSPSILMARFPSDMQKYKAGYKRNEIICINHPNAYPKKNPRSFRLLGFGLYLLSFYLKSSSNFFSIASPRMLRAMMVPSWSMSRV